MGTHPIFESDFDCLTELETMALRRLTVNTFRQVSARSLSTTSVAPKAAEVFSIDKQHAAWIEYFDSEECDYWYLRNGLMQIFSDDQVPTPEIIQSMLYCCRRNNNLPAAVRVMEQVKIKCNEHRDIYEYIMQELQPTFADLGMMTAEDLGLDVVATDFES